MHQAALLGQALQDSRKFGWQFTEEGKEGELFFCCFVICAENPEVLFTIKCLLHLSMCWL